MVIPAKLAGSADSEEIEGLHVRETMHIRKDFAPGTMVVDVDELLELCVAVWFEQERDNQV